MNRWFRHYAGMMRDEKLVAVAVKSRQSVERVMWVWGAILESAAEINDNGKFNLDAAEAAYFLRADEADICAILDTLTHAGRLDAGIVVKWGDRQFSSDKSKERQAAYRERQRKNRSHGDDTVGKSDVTVTSRHAKVTAQETETETENIEPKGSSTRCAKPDDVSDEVWQDFKRHRARHGGISDRVIAGFRREAAKAGWSLEQAMDESITQGWRGFKAEYVKNRQAPSRGASLAEIGEEVRRLYEH